MRILLVGALLFSLSGIVSCGDQMQGTDVIEGTTDGTGSNDKPTTEEQRQFFEAQKRKVDVAHKSIQIMAINDRTVVLRATLNVAGVDQFMTLTPTNLGVGDVASINREVNGAQVEIVLYRALHDGTKSQILGVEYRVSRSGNGIGVLASQFLRLRMDRLNNIQIVTKQKFEFPSKTNLMEWVFEGL